jgi:excinuclease ABC subunit C
LKLVQRVRDEAHRFAIARHRKTRIAGALRSRLRQVPGVGPVKAKALLRKFGSIGGMKEAPREAIASVVGARTAESVIEHLRNDA